jgi:hypothetical protein
MVTPLWRGRGERPGPGCCTNPEHFEGVAIVNGSITQRPAGVEPNLRAFGCRLTMWVGLAVDRENGFRVDRASPEGDAWIARSKAA